MPVCERRSKAIFLALLCKNCVKKLQRKNTVAKLFEVQYQGKKEYIKLNGASYPALLKEGWDSDMASLLLLVYLLPPPAGKKGTVKISVWESVDHLVKIHKSCCSLQEHSGPEQRSQPYILAVGKARISIHEYYISLDGNPGVVGFYKTFLQTLYRAFGRHYPVWAVSHAGHCEVPDTMDIIDDPSVMATGDVFGLNGQVEHKLAFLRDHVTRDTGLVLIGHSIGCYIILEMMKRDPELQVRKSVMLFPTIERMAVTPQGRVMTPVLCRLRYVAYLPIFLLSLLPDLLKTFLVKLVFRRLRSLDQSIVLPTVRLINVDTAANAMYMANQEMLEVLERDNTTINQNLDKLVFYYGAADHWCPVQYYQEIKRDFPNGDIRLCSRGIRHAFVLDAGKEVADMIVEWICGDLQTWS
ncbi:hypothetical protein DPEC_G00294780 [Dallia pectoralis]|uniref:Uncharacterized protein n=1 Tax=Dallia pectoralis TaxID=75939 RepID=A0ACC2FIW0_DALPE|nr:hypothetical protein DPEC_G00294780 [Dallia pectoralis]